jgi:hypothetical protein
VQTDEMANSADQPSSQTTPARLPTFDLGSGSDVEIRAGDDDSECGGDHNRHE